MIIPTYQRVMVSLALVIGLVCSAAVASAGTRLYTGTIQVRLRSCPECDYSVPFGANFSYPKMNNLPSGDLATTSGSAPQAVRLAPKQLVLTTSLFTFSPPWYHTLVTTHFAGANDAASFSAGGAPGAAKTSIVTTVSGGQFGVSFSGTPTQFGGTMRLLADFRARYGLFSAANLPLGAIGGSFGGKLTATGYQGGTAFPPTFFTETIWGFPWTTGTVMATAPAHPYYGGPSATSRLTDMGSDLRDSKGSGKVRLVTPFFVRKRAGSDGALLQGHPGIAIVSLQFAPEPSVILQLAAGLSALAVLYRYSHRKRG